MKNSQNLKIKDEMAELDLRHNLAHGRSFLEPPTQRHGDRAPHPHQEGYHRASRGQCSSSSVFKMREEHPQQELNSRRLGLTLAGSTMEGCSLPTTRRGWRSTGGCTPWARSWALSPTYSAPRRPRLVDIKSSSTLFSFQSKKS